MKTEKVDKRYVIRLTESEAEVWIGYNKLDKKHLAMV